MAAFEDLHTVSKEASADLSTKQFLFVDVNANGQLVVVSGAGGKALGVLQDKPSAQGRAGEVGYSGTTKMISAAAVAAGASVSSNNAGKAQTAVSGNIVLGQAMEAAGGADITFEVMLGVGSRILP